MMTSTYGYSSDRLSTGELLKETKLLFNHQGSDAELVKQIAIAVQAISALGGGDRIS
jgi:hypothetical protein